MKKMALGLYHLLSSLFILTCVIGRPILAEDDDETEVKSKVDVKTVFSPPKCVRKVEKKDFVRYHYYGMLEDGTYFDSSHSRGHSYDTYVFNGWLIPGMDQGLLGMCVNEQRILSIPSELAYGDRGSGSIPGGATILFNTILLDVWNEKDEVQITITKEVPGCKRKLEKGDYVRYHYNGTLMNGMVFHTSYQERSTYNTYVGQGWLIKGMDVGLMGACMGERRRIVIPPFMAYGEKGDGKNIPPSATVIFDVDIIDFHNPKDNVEIIITKEAENCPRKVEATDFIRYHYNGTFMDGTLFDSSYKRGRTYDTYVMMKRLIPGVDRGILGACVGERRRVIVPPHLGYGEPGVDGVIPPSSVLVFDIHVIDFHNPKDQVQEEILQKVEDDDARVVKAGDFVKFDYTLELMDETLIISSSNSSWGVYTGRRRIPEGMEIGMMGMKVGEKKKIIVPPHLGYGEFGKKDFVPGSAVLVYTMECKEILDGVPRGQLVRWNVQAETKDVKEAFTIVDADKNESVDRTELLDFINTQIDLGNVVLDPGRPASKVLDELIASTEADSISDVQFLKFMREHGAVHEEKNEL